MKNAEPVRVFLGSHLTTWDAIAAAEHMRWCDVFVPELVGWNEATLKAYNLAAVGQLDASACIGRAQFGDFAATQLLLISHSGKKVAYADVPDGDSLADELHELGELTELLSGARQPWESAKSALAITYQHFAEANIRREAHIVGRIVELVREHPGKRILVRLGSAHMPVVGALIARGIRTRIVLQRPMPVSGTDSQLYQYALRGTIPDGAIARHLLVSLLEQYWVSQWYNLDPYVRDRMLQRIARTFTPRQFRELWDLYASDGLTGDLVRQRVREHGFTADEL